MLAWSWLACTTSPPAEGLRLASAGDLGPLGHLIRIERPEPGDLFVVCRADPGEVHLVEADEGALVQELAVLGLLAETDYRCEAHSGPRSAEITFRTGSLPELPPWTVQGETAGYTLFNTRHGIDGPEPSYLVIVDGLGQVRWIYDAGPDLVCDLDAQVVMGELPIVHMGGGWGTLSASAARPGMYRDIDLRGQTLVDRERPAFGIAFNHHSQRLADGSTLSLTASDEGPPDNPWIGVGVERWREDRGLVWSFSTGPLVESGVLEEPEPDSGAPFLANAAVLAGDPLGEALWVSSFRKKELWRIDTATSLPTHRFGASSGLSLRSPSGEELPASEWPYVQHDPQLTDGPYGEDTRLLLYDNGAGRPGGSYSRVAEYDLDLPNNAAILLWSFTEEGWYTPIIGGVQRTSEGTVLVAKGVSAEHTPDGTDTSALIEIAPPGGVLWRLTLGDRGWPIYRAERLPDCSLFGDAALCPEVAQRLAERLGEPM